MNNIHLLYDAENVCIRLCNTEYGTDRPVPLEFLIDNKRLTNMPGNMEFRTERPGVLRVRGRGRAALRFLFNGMKQFENACPREDGGLEVAFLQTGKLLFVPMRGALWHNAMWVPAKAQVDDFILDLLPSAETLEFEAAIHAYYSNGVRDADYAPFDTLKD